MNNLTLEKQDSRVALRAVLDLFTSKDSVIGEFADKVIIGIYAVLVTVAGILVQINQNFVNDLLQCWKTCS